MSDSHQGGLGLGRWVLSSVASGGFAGSFLGDSATACADINVGGKSFALFANPASAPLPSSTATKEFAKPAMTTGDALSFSVAVNYRNGMKGFSLRDSSGVSRFNFTVGRVDGVNGGYYVRNGTSSVAPDNGQSLGAYHAQTYFVFTFTQSAGSLDWTIRRGGGIEVTHSGSLAVQSGTIADLQFFVTGTESGSSAFHRAANNLYFNSVAFSTPAMGDSPLTPGERRLPGLEPSYTLRYQHSSPVSSVTVRHSGDGFVNSVPMTLTSGVWELDIRQLGLPPGWHEFKFRPDGNWEAGANRVLYLDQTGRLAKPPAVYLTWKSDPASTMIIHWHNYGREMSSVSWRPFDSTSSWSTGQSTSEEFPHTERWIHTAELTGLQPDSEYEFRVEGYPETFRFKTMPASLSRPVSFAVGGDVSIGPAADAMTSAISTHSPDFIVIGGDLSYADERAENSWKWYRYFESWHHRARTPDGRLIPKIVAVGNHEVYGGLVQNHPDFEPTQEWRRRYAPCFYSCFAFPGQPGYGVLDFGQYMSLVILDTDHTNRIEDQVPWLSTVLAARKGRPHLIPIYHTPAYTSNRSFTDQQASGVRQHWVPLFEESGVRLAFEHHDHTFKVTRPLLGGSPDDDGIVFVGDGLWGIESRPPDASRWYLQASSQQHHVHLVTVDQSGRTVRSVGSQGQFLTQPGGGDIVAIQPTDEAPTAASAFLAALGRDHLTLRWSPVARARSYTVVRSDGQEFEVTGEEFTDWGWSPAAAYSYEVYPKSRSGVASSATTLSPSGRQAWAVSNELPWDGTGAGAMDADPDADGRPNLAEYFHGSDPLSPSSSAVWLPQGFGGTFEARYRKLPEVENIVAEVLWSDSLSPTAQWSSVGTQHRLIGVDPIDPSAEWHGVSVPASAHQPRLFLRLSLTDTTEGQ